MNLYSNGERIIRATGRAYEAIYRAQGFRPYVEETESEGDKDDGKADQNGTGAEDTGKGKKPAAGRKPTADK